MPVAIFLKHSNPIGHPQLKARVGFASLKSHLIEFDSRGKIPIFYIHWGFIVYVEDHVNSSDLHAEFRHMAGIETEFVEFLSRSRKIHAY